MVEPRRTNDLKDSEEPRCVKSSTDNENTEPNLAKPRRDTEDPKRANDLSDSEEPK
jgi:hypothetical protein